jgi:ABC-type nitrate/sulfonate/bicarbonate transport system ATPase subunit
MEMRATARDEIVAEHVTKVYEDIERGEEVVALRDFSLTVRSNEFLAILGPSGCGKSTFLNIVAGFEPCTGGQVTVNGERVTGPGADRGVVFQDFALFPWLTVEQNIEFGLRNQGVPAERRKALTQSMIRLVHLDGCDKRYPRELSGGMKQRVAIARVLANDSRILLMDEPFGALDALTRYAMQKQLLEIWARNQKMVLFITHSIDEALYLADRVVILSARPGRILEILEIPDPRPRDLGSPIFNEMRATALRLLEAEVNAAAREAATH